MITSQNGINLIKEFEGCRLTAYKCPAGVWTIGIGHTGNIKAGQTITMERAEQLLKQDLVTYETAVTVWNYMYNWNQNEFDALVSFTFNCGTGSLRNLLKNGTRSRAEIRAALPLYNKDINGRQLPGLVRRRQAELNLFNKIVPIVPADPEKDYETVEDIVKGIWAGDFGTPWSKSDKLYKYFQKKVNEYKGVK